MNRKVFNAAFKSSLPVLMGYLSMGAAAGILLGGLVTGPAAAFWAFLSSGTIISGTIQFILVGWIRDQTPLTDVILLTVFLNIRYAMYGFSLIERFRGISLWKKLYLILALTDETYALEVENKVPPGEDSLTYCMTIAALDHLYWITGVVAGALIGTAVPFSTRGIDFAMTALFLVILVDQCREKSSRIPAVTGLAAAIAARCFFTADRMVIPSIVLMIAVFLILRKKIDRKPERHAS